MSDWDYGIYFFQSSLLSCFSVTNTYCSYDKDCFQVIKKLTKRPLPVGHHSSVKNKKEKEMLLFYIQCLQITSFLTKWFFFFFEIQLMILLLEKNFVLSMLQFSSLQFVLT